MFSFSIKPLLAIAAVIALGSGFKLNACDSDERQPSNVSSSDSADVDDTGTQTNYSNAESPPDEIEPTPEIPRRIHQAPGERTSADVGYNPPFPASTNASAPNSSQDNGGLISVGSPGSGPGTAITTTTADFGR